MTEPSSPLVARDITLGYGRSSIIDGLNVSIPAGSVTTIIGPNGCGKSTLLRGFGRLLRTREGEILLHGAPIDGMRTRDIARRVAILPQAPSAPEGLTVAELVSRGRHPHQSWARQWSSDDEAEIGAALALTGMTHLAGRPIDELSGGQRQRAWIAMTLAQGTEILLLDEPTTYLDLAHAVDVLDLVDRLNDELGRTVLMVLHDLNLAARYSDRIIVMKEGRVVTVGTPQETITVEMLREVFGLSATVMIDDESGAPTVIPHSTRRATRIPVD
ncbi:ABC transporter ATP-binding protein [Agreia bicolorata]|uniref:ABC transporter n=1 Tax=Agreia bicolorata TaxID=110935 RepID=A0ABR5CBV4_9MICO|nr:ABC transporter ATP-binding protein [Agreia bicolorata]KJC63036.1 ABC transporter [Agreia bicolorata]